MDHTLLFRRLGIYAKDVPLDDSAYQPPMRMACFGQYCRQPRHWMPFVPIWVFR